MKFMEKLSETIARIRQNPAWMVSSLGLLPLFMMAHFGHHMVNSLAIPLLPMIRQDFGLDYTQSGLLVAALTIPYGLSQFPAGWLADRMGPRILLTIGISGVAAAGLLAGLSHNYHLMLICLMAMGVTGGGYHPAAPPLISALVEPKNRGRAMGLHMVGGSAPFFLAPLIAVALAAAWGWRGTFIALAIPTILFGIFFYMILGRRLNARTVENTAGGPTGREETAPPGTVHRIVPFIVLSTFTHAVTYCVIAFIPLFLVDRFGLSKEAAAAFISIFYSAGLWASLLGGTLSDRLGSVPVVVAVSVMTGPAIYLLNFIPSAFGVGCLLFVMGVLNYIRTPVSETYLVGQTTERNRSTVLGIYYFSTYEGGGVLTPVMGLLMDHYGFDVSFAIAGATLLLLFLPCWFWLRGCLSPEPWS
jgi:MFS transporter, FSR family, fosmidomycin resistance protein